MFLIHHVRAMPVNQMYSLRYGTVPIVRKTGVGRLSRELRCATGQAPGRFNDYIRKAGMGPDTALDCRRTCTLGTDGP